MNSYRNRLIQGDCVRELEKIPAGSVDLVFADPPFNIGYEYDVYDDRRPLEDYLGWCREWMTGVQRALKPDGTFWLAIGDEYAAELKVLAGEIGFSCRSWVIWYYTFGVNCVRGFSRSHTHLFHFVRDPANFTFNADNPQNRVPSARQLVYADARANPRGRLPDNTWIYRPQDLAGSGFAPGDDTWYFARVAGTFHEREGFHGCQMPEQLLGRIIRVSSDPLDLVLDPFAGSGTTLAVAKKLGRDWLGFELSEDYARAIGERLEATATGDPLNGPADPLRSAPRTGQVRRRARSRSQSTPEMDDGVIAAFGETAQGLSADQLLCDPERNAAFLKACRARKLEGADRVWNRRLLALRKSGRLPRAKGGISRARSDDQDAYSFASEIASRLMEIDYGMNIESFLCAPECAQAFDQMASEYAPGFRPNDYRWAALTFRKRRRAVQRIAAEMGPSVWEQPLPRSRQLDGPFPASLAGPAVYAVCRGDQVLYVGETVDLAARLQNLREQPAWQELEPQSIRIQLTPDASTGQRQAIQAILVSRLQPLLNSRLFADVAQLEPV